MWLGFIDPSEDHNVMDDDLKGYFSAETEVIVDSEDDLFFLEGE